MSNPYLLADDLSGALEAGAAFRARGERVTLGLTNHPASSSGLRVVSTETRNLPPAAAADSVRQVLVTQQAAGARLLFKKIDSTLRGPVGAEIKVLSEELAPPLIVVCPATPAAGRTVRAGILRVGGVPVSESDFRHDPGWPITESSVAAVLSSSGVDSVECLSLDELRNGDAAGRCWGGVLVGDAETDDDLRRMVTLVRRMEPAAIFVGAGGLAHAVAVTRSGSAAPLPVPAPGSILFVSGSLSERSRRQLEILRDECAVPVHEVGPSAHDPQATARTLARSLATRQVAALAVARDGGRLTPSEPVAWLAAVVRSLVESGQEPDMLVATGGETARLLCTIAGVRELELVREYEPGVVLAAVSEQRAARLKWVVIKPGGFGSERVWADVYSGNLASR